MGHSWRAPRVQAVAGDLAKPLLGLAPERFNRLANEVDAIVHNGAQVSLVLPYPVLKPTNVLGTREVLRLACQGSPKPLHYISSLAVCSLKGRADRVVREDDDLGDADQVFGGYAQSKWVAERLVGVAQSRGLPVAIYRPGMITGHSRTGVSNPNDFMTAILRGCIQLRCVPVVKTSIEMTPVDYVSGAVVQLSRDRHSVGKVFHLSNPSTVEWNELVRWVGRRGYPLQPVPFVEWLSRVYSLGEGIRSNALYPFLPLLSERNAEMRALLGVDFSQIELPQYDKSFRAGAASFRPVPSSSRT
jgi:thioester reductase-like protein